MKEVERCPQCGQTMPRALTVNVAGKEVPAQMRGGKLLPKDCAGLKCRDCMRCV